MNSRMMFRLKFLRKALLVGALLIQQMAIAHKGYEKAPRADVIFHNAVILTMEMPDAVKQAIAIKGNKIIAVDTDLKVLELAGPDTKVVDMKGYTIMPGLVDAHSHWFNDFWEGNPDIEDSQDLMIKNGITTVGNMYATPEVIAYMRDYEPNLKVRTSLYMTKTTNCGDVEDNWYLNYPPTSEPGEMLRIGGIKIFADGGSCGAPAVSVERVPGGGLGNLFHTQGLLTQMVKKAHDANYQVAIHGIGDRGIEQALNAIEYALDGEPNHLRHRIEHSAILTPELIDRFGELDVIATIFGYKRTCWLPEELPEFYQQAENAHRSLIDQNPNLYVAWHGDDPIVEPANPFIDMFSLATRIDVISEEQPCYPPDWLADETLSVKQILKIMTLGSAYALNRDDEVGSLRPGKFADLIAISANPLKVDSKNLKDIYVWLTMIDGEVLYYKSMPRKFEDKVLLN